MKVFFRADGNTKIGLGHITRCLALADMLKNDFECIFLVQNPSEIIKQQIKENFELIILPQTGELVEDFLVEAYFIVENYLKIPCIVVLDHYKIQTDYQKILKENINQNSGALVCIDDLHQWHFVADVVINHAGGIKASDYSCEKYTKLCLGLDYALLREPFLEVAKAKLSQKTNKNNNLFICFGGSDSLNLTKKALQSCVEVAFFKEIFVVVGSSYVFYEDLENYIKSHQNVKLYQNLDAQSLCEVMQACEVAIVPASSVAVECLAVGLKLIVGYYVENQRGIYEGLLQKNAFGIGNFEDFNEKKLVDFIEKIKQNEIKKDKFVFPDVKRNILNTFLEYLIKSSVFIRNATIDDARLYFDWANEPEVRKNSLNSAPILWENHLDWFEKKLKDNQTVFYVFEQKNNSLNLPIGQVRLDLNKNKALINYSIDKNFRGKSLGKIIIEKTISSFLKNNPDAVFEAYVKKDNIASKVVFEKLNFQLEEETILYKFILK